jgi:hypothetical protein
MIFHQIVQSLERVCILCCLGVALCCEIEHRPQLFIPHNQNSLRLDMVENQILGLDMKFRFVETQAHASTMVLQQLDTC